MNPSHSLLHELHLLTLFGVHTPARCRNSINMLDKLKLELVPADGDKLVLKLSPPPPPLADKQACACAHVRMRSHLQDLSSGLLADTGVTGGQHDR